MLCNRIQRHHSVVPYRWEFKSDSVCPWQLGWLVYHFLSDFQKGAGIPPAANQTLRWLICRLFLFSGLSNNYFFGSLWTLIDLDGCNFLKWLTASSCRPENSLPSESRYFTRFLFWPAPHGDDCGWTFTNWDSSLNSLNVFIDRFSVAWGITI